MPSWPAIGPPRRVSCTPGTVAKARAALALACLEKAAYELLYEADYRPDWLEVPLAGLAELTEHLLKGKNR